MSKKVSEILNSDIQVPEIVQKKADVAFSQIQSERETNMGKKNLKVTKLFAAMAVCASIIIVASTTNNYLNRPQEEKKQQWQNIRQQKREYVYHESNGGTGRSDGTEACSNRTK